MKKNLLLTFSLFHLGLTLLAQEKTWSEHIAPIIYENCASCHHDGGIAPFSLMSYDDTVPWADDIHHVIEERSMPPWPADPEYRHFVGEARLTQTEIETIHDWIAAEMPLGDEALAPEPPVFLAEGSVLDQIDYTVAIAPYTLQYDTDEYRWFVIENPFDEPIYISQLEVMAGLKEVVHHADLFYDLSGNSLAFDQADPLPGFNSSTGWPNNDYYINAWQPGGNVATYPENWGIKVPPEANFVIEVHYGPGGIGLTDSTYMNLKFVTNPTTVRSVRTAWLLTDSPPVLVNGPLVIPANEVVTFHQQSAPLSQDLSLISICPHMHWLGKSYRVWFENPEGDSIPLINIPQWDFHWQKYYTFQQIQKVPAGSVLKSEGVYDNTLDNHDNLNNPPITVYKGPTTEDEMFLCYFIYAPYQEGDEHIVLDSTILTTSISTLKHQIPYSLFPNPTKEYLNLEGPLPSNEKMSFRILNTLGQTVLQGIQNINSLGEMATFNVKELNSGIYFLEWYEGEQVRSMKFLKE